MRGDLERALRDEEDDPPAWLVWLIAVVAAIVLVGLLWLALNMSAHASVLDGMQLPPEQSTGIPMLDAYSPDPHQFCTPEHHVCRDEEAGRCVLPKPQPDEMTGDLVQLMSKASPCLRWIRVRLSGEPDELLFCVENEKPRPVTPPAPSDRCLLNGTCRMA